MSAPDTENPTPSIAEQLEQQLEAARKGKTLMQVPALRRLRNVVRVYVVIGGLVQLSVLLIGVFLRMTHDMNASGRGTLRLSEFFVYAVSMWIWIPVIWLLLIAYARFLKQFRQNQVQDIAETTRMILGLWNYNLFFALLTFGLQFIILGERLVGKTLGFSLGNVLGVVIMFIVVRRYVKAAQAELPLLTAAARESPPRGNYRAWKQLFFIFLGVAFVVIGLGYWVGAKVELAMMSVAINASLPRQLDSETLLDTTTSGPGNRLTYYFTLVNLATADLNLDQFTQVMRQQLANNYRSNPDMAGLRTMQVELHFVYRDKRGNTVTTIILSPRDL
jgi:hypothetical protein